MAEDTSVQTFEFTEDEVDAVVALIKGGLEATDAWGRHVFRIEGNRYMIQWSYRGCSDYPTAEKAAREFLFGAQRQATTRT